MLAIGAAGLLSAGVASSTVSDQVDLSAGSPSENQEVVPIEEISVLLIESGTTHTIASDDTQLVEGVEWEPDSTLEIEPGGELSFEAET